MNFTLQPLVENAILHGIDEHEGVRGKLVIRAEVRGGDILFAVSDNGVGMDPEFAASLTARETAGYGLKNVNERIGEAGVRRGVRVWRAAWRGHHRVPAHTEAGFLKGFINFEMESALLRLL